MIEFPFRKAAPLDIKQELSKLINTEFYQHSDNYINELNLLNEMRMTIVALPDMQRHYLSVQNAAPLIKYYGQIHQLINKLSNHSINIMWSNCFLNDRTFVTQSLKFEQIGVLYQLAALYSILAINENYSNNNDNNNSTAISNNINLDDNNESIKIAGVYFQYAAGCFSEIENILTNETFDPQFDLSINSVKSLNFLSLAQAQELFWIKAKRDQLKDTVIIRLTIMLSELYNNAWEFAVKSNCIPNSWLNYMKVKSVHFISSSYLKYAEHISQKEKYGDEIAYLRQAQKLIKSIHINNNDKLLENIIKSGRILKQNIDERLYKAERENELIHLQNIPGFDEFKNLPGAMLVSSKLPKELNDDFINTTQKSGLFANLVPQSIIKEAKVKKEELNLFVEDSIINTIQLYTKDINLFIESTHIQSQIDILTTLEKIPQSVLDNREKILSFGSLEKISNMMNELAGIKINCRESLDSCWQFLKEEISDDQKLKSLYGQEDWKVGFVDSDNNGRSLLKHFEEFEMYMLESENSDKSLYHKIDQLKPFIEIFSTVDKLESYVSSADISELNPKLVESANKLQNILNQFSFLTNEMNSLKQKVENKRDNLSVKLLQDLIQKHSESQQLWDQILHDFKLKFQDETNNISLLQLQIQNLKSSFNETVVEFVQQKSNLQISKVRENELHVLQTTAQGYFEILGNLREGITFYTNLKANMDVQRKQLDEFLVRRRQIKLQNKNNCY